MPKRVGTFKDRGFTAIGSYIFAGGFALGVQRHFNVLCHLEETDYGVDTCHRNFPQLPIYVGFDHWPIEQLQMAQPVDLIFTNPPCAAWSPAGFDKKHGTGKWLTDPRVGCARKCFSLLGALRPRVWVWESVVQAYTKGWDFVRDLTVMAIQLGYSVTYLLHNSQYFGVPQIRKRFFMVCHRVPFEPIEPGWGKIGRAHV